MLQAIMTRRSRQKLGTFRGNYQVLGFYEDFRKKLQKLWHFVKNHQNLSISPKLAFSGANYHVLGFWSSFQQKVWHFVKKPSKLKIVDLAKLNYSSNFSCKLNCHVLGFSSSFQKVWDFVKTIKTCKFGQN